MYLEKKAWSTDDYSTQVWVAEILWSSIKHVARTEQTGATPPDLPTPPHKKAIQTLREVLKHHDAFGLVANCFGEQVDTILGSDVARDIERSRFLTTLYEQELRWIFGPKLGSSILPLGGYAMRSLYRSVGDGEKNPRVVSRLEIWTPTMTVREDAAQLLTDAGYTRKGEEGFAHVFKKQTNQVWHQISLIGLMWESSKSWSGDLERDMWARILPSELAGLAKFEVTDWFLYCCRRLSIDTLMGGAMELLDLYMLLKARADEIDWGRVKALISSFAKPDWITASLLALTKFEDNVGQKTELPTNVRAILSDHDLSLWDSFIDTRWNWASPDARLVDFSRVYARAAKGI